MQAAWVLRRIGLPGCVVRCLRASTLWLAAAVGLVLSGCGGGDSGAAPPVFNIQPATVMVSVGQNAVFSAQARAPGYVTYQWYRNGVRIAGQTGPTLALMATDAEDGAEFVVRACTFGNCVDSNPAALRVGPGNPISPGSGAIAPLITRLPVGLQLTPGATAQFAVAATGSAPLSYEWQRNGVAIPGAVGETYTLPGVALSDSGAAFTVVVTNAAGSAQATVGLLVSSAAVVPTIAPTPGSVTAPQGGQAAFVVSASGTQPIAYQWRRNGVEIAGAIDAFYVLGLASAADDGAVFSVQVGNPAGTRLSPDITLRVTAAPVAPTITLPPQAASVNLGFAAAFSVAATGTAPLSYRWQKNGLDIAGATGGTYLLASTSALDQGAVLRVQVSNAAGSAMSSPALLTVGNVPIAPTVVTHPGATAVQAGQSASFSVVATGTAALSYQWQRNGTDIAGATGPSLSVSNVLLVDNGAQFRVVVSNAAGSATSASALLIVSAAPVAPGFDANPLASTVQAGGVATFFALASGTQPLAYQWRRDGVDIAGATTAVYATPTTTLADNGAAFTVRVSNVAGSVVSTAALLTVTAAPVAPTVVTQPQDVTVNAGSGATFSVDAGSGPLAYQWRRDGADIAGANASSYSFVAAIADNAAVFSVRVFAISNSGAASVLSGTATLTVNALWTPASATNKLLWLDADDVASVVKDGLGAISQWSDKSGLGHHALQATASQQPMYATSQLNGRAVVAFDGVNDMLQLALRLSQNRASAFVVSRKMSGGTAINTDARVLDFTNSADGSDYGNSNPWIALYYAGSLVSDYRDSGGLSLNEGYGSWNLTTSVLDGGTLNLWNNDRSASGTTSTVNISTDQCTLGSHPSSAGNKLNGDIAEVLVFDAVMPDAQRQRVEGYLAHKWGLTANLPMGHPYKNAPP